MKRFIRNLFKATTNALLGFIVVGVLVAVGQESFYRFTPAEFFLTSKDVTVNSAVAGKPVPFEWCREPRTHSIEARAVRTFYRLNNETSRFEQAGQYSFEPQIDINEDDCQPLVITEERQPQIDGTYYFRTDLTWREHGYEKKLSYQSNPYNLVATPVSLTKRIQELEAEINKLEQRIEELNRKNGVVSSNSTDSTSSSTEKSNVAQSSEPPENQPQAQNQQNSPAQSIIEETPAPNFVQRVLQNIRKTIGL